MMDLNDDQIFFKDNLYNSLNFISEGTKILVNGKSPKELSYVDSGNLAYSSPRKIGVF